MYYYEKDKYWSCLDCHAICSYDYKEDERVEQPSPLKNQVGGSHYASKKIQPIEYIMENGLNFPEGCIVKYITRHREKGQANDIRKIIHFCQIILEKEYGEH
jgi:hypothetical protein